MAQLSMTLVETAAQAQRGPALGRQALALCLLLLATPACTTDDIDCFESCPADPLIINFDNNQVQGSLYAEGGLGSLLQDGTWRITGPGAGASFGVHFPCMLQAGVFDGLRVHIVNHSAGVRLTWEIESVSNLPPDAAGCSSRGTCQGDCALPTNSPNVNPEFGVDRAWTAFSGGNPHDNPSPNELVGMRWRLPEDAGDVDLVIDELRFITP